MARDDEGGGRNNEKSVVGCLTGCITSLAAAGVTAVGEDEGGGNDGGMSVVGCLTGGTNVVAVGKSAGESWPECTRTEIVPRCRVAESNDVGCLTG